MTSPSIFMLDTNMVSYVIKGQSANARQKMNSLGEEENVCISSITEAEIHYGLAKRQVKPETRVEIQRFLDTIDILAWDSKAARMYGQMRAKFETAGRAVGNMDLLIAAHAAAIGAVLVTNDRVFENTEGFFAIVNWANDLHPK